MTAWKTWLQRTGTLLSALMIVMLAAGPGIDALVCGDETPAAVGDLSHVTLTADDQYKAAVNADQGGDICPHGHCHHALSYVATDAEMPREVENVPTRYQLVSQSVRIERSPFELNRPPRA